MMSANDGKWQFWIDLGGTFADIVARAPDGRVIARKLLSASPDYDDAALAGIRAILGVPPEAPIPAGTISAVKMGTTVATNALLERKGETTLLVTTKGLGDQLEIGNQARPDIFAREIVKPSMLYSRVVEAHERIRADGTVETPLDTKVLKEALTRAAQDGLRSVAIVLLHAYAHPAHEREAARLAFEAGFTQVSVSHEVSPLIRIVGRGDTTVADAYLTPLLKRYVERIAGELGVDGRIENDQAPKLMFMASSGGLKTAHAFQGRDAILSGPAGGIVGMVETARRAGFDRVIGFDMGGTSTDVSHFAGEYERTFETVVAGARLRVPMLSIHTVAAGGGSILSYDGVRLTAGPESAGSNPGPMCYRRGGPLTITDANVMTGKLQPQNFPPIFGKSGTEPIDRTAVESAFSDLAKKIGGKHTPEAIADGCIRIAVESMAAAIKKISVERGYDVTRYALSCFGSAGGQHACQIADVLGIDTILVHPLSGLLSAYGIGLSPLRASREQSIEAALSEASMGTIESHAWRLGEAVTEELLDAGVEADDIALTTRLHIRYDGTDTALPVLLSEPPIMRRDFEEAHRTRFSFISPEKQIVVAHIEVEAVGGGATLGDEHEQDANGMIPRDPLATEPTRFFSVNAWQDARMVKREALRPGHTLAGPALLIEPHQTVVVEPGWTLDVTRRNDLVIRRIFPRAHKEIGTGADPVLLEVFNNRFMSIAEEMGEALRATAQSVNIKERLDFSCAVFDGAGNLVANAPHMPVHLGSMDSSVATVIRETHGSAKAGDAFMLNAPYDGGTHLPDITVVSPVFDEAGGKLLFWIASRGHHADIGGIAPGSMSPLARSIDEEGVYIDCTQIVSGGAFREEDVLSILRNAKYPARNPEQNVADLKAQLAANARGAAELNRLVSEFGVDVVCAFMGHVQDNAEEAVRHLIARLNDGHFRSEMDDGTAIEVRIRIDKEARSATVDFTGTSPQQATNFNAPEPVTRAAVLYAFRVMVDESIPMNAGCMRPISIVIPENSLLKPHFPAAVVAGNVETSQVVTNTLFAALGGLGSAQGTMNNLTFGNDHVQYYETICSGAPAGPGFNGVAAVHVHMTNTRLTDPEVLEHRLPVVLEEFSIRRGSGGKGKWSSGDGIRRAIRFLEPMHCAILSGYRKVRPFGIRGGDPGQCGTNTIRRKNGTIVPLAGCDQTVLDAGDTVIIETPTGGGYGKD
jgi:5-oxoprolinase (ATP-hydrolysing)